MIRRPPRSTLSSSSAASDVYKRQLVETREEERVVKRTIHRSKFATSIDGSSVVLPLPLTLKRHFPIEFRDVAVEVLHQCHHPIVDFIPPIGSSSASPY